MKETNMNMKVWTPCIEKFRFTEEVNPNKPSEKRFILRGMMLPFNKISRNNVLYNTDSIKEKHKQLIGRPVMYNHQIEGHELPVGHYIDSTIKEDGWHYEADIDPQEKDMIRKLERGDLRHTSIQLVAGKAIERENENGSYTEAFVSDVIEGSIVPAPGFLDTTASFAEAFKQDKISKGEAEELLKMEPGLKKEIQENFDIGTRIQHKDQPDQQGTILKLLDNGKYEVKMDSGEIMEHSENEIEPTNNQSEDVTTTTADGAIQPKKIVDDDELNAEKILEKLGEKEVEKLLTNL